jgi:Malectin domain
MRISFSVRASVVLLVGFLVIGRAGRSEANYYWQAGNAPVTMWSTSKGYCYLSEMVVGALTNDSVSVSVSNGYWMLSGVGTTQEGGSEFGTGSCVPWPAGYSKIDPQFSASTGRNLSNNSCFCHLAGAKYDGNVYQHVPQFRIMGYPTSQTSVFPIYQDIGNDSSQLPAHQVSGQCICPSQPGLLYWEGTSSGHNISTYTSSYGAEVTMTGTNTICAAKEVRTAVNGHIYFSIWFSGSTWYGYSGSSNVVTYNCIPYPGPVVQMDTGSANTFFDATGPDWKADANFDTGYTTSTGNDITTIGVDRPAPLDVYKSIRFNTGNFQYTFSGYTAYSQHTVRLHFVEAWANGAMLRRFHVWVNGTKYLNNFDIWSTAGGLNKANVQTVLVNANSAGQIQILFTPGSNDYPIVSGIEIQ